MSKGLKASLLLGVLSAFLWLTQQPAAAQLTSTDAWGPLFPSQAASFDSRLAEDLGQIWDGDAKTYGIDLGHRAAAAILALRANDGSQHVEPRVGVDFITSNEPGKWRQDPISQIPLALGAYWGQVKPFVLWSADQFRVPPPPALESLAYTTAFYEVKLLGGDGVVTPTVRTGDQTFTGIYWGYDGTPGLGTPPRMYNQITVHIAVTFVSDEFNGMTRDNQGNVRPLAPRSFSSLSEAEEENGQSRIYLGIHWAFDKTEGIAQGRRAGDFVFENAFVPVP